MNATRETCYVSNAGTNMSFPQRDRRTDRQCSCWDSGPVVAGGVTTTQGAQETGRQGRRGLDIWAERMSHGQHYAVITSLKVVAAKMQKQPDWNAGCAERCLSGVGRAGRNSTAERQHGRRPSTPYQSRQCCGSHSDGGSRPPYAAPEPPVGILGSP